MAGDFILVLKCLCFAWFAWLVYRFLVESFRVSQLERAGAKIGVDSPLVLARRERDGTMSLLIVSAIFLLIFVLGEHYLGK